MSVDTATWPAGRHPSIETLTTPGHALLGTGIPPAYRGIIGNEWWHRDLGASLKSVQAPSGERSTMWLRVPGIAHALARFAPTAKAVSVSLKIRAAMLPLGQHGGTAVYYDASIAAWATTKNQPHGSQNVSVQRRLLPASDISAMSEIRTIWRR